ncbi:MULTISPECIES: enoyl-CoA hydratase-related protein [Rhodococcus]|uniref:Enoyl-CoA hydratase-related protein n=1 Tax=Rhodococcus oxybenzonivorans TaxID=1990687 RepID=A0AAE4V356_9NOCA|nr:MULTISPECIES: enoyl-CoA hydratase-related protein [Rhodococcus]MDV7240969.1 enoyl-CoA hydratase-related protein [Rhodococcus oxybenzonivorans]MDV7266939.1 enoyl-CoA hydratase-related protein [Rhodococcus oxybenzonivorans]MDV7273242.1 enoyl-CoA hydratase-related protein [Rhodococcus oxybenzonivorans]MDV7333020.1 enoyl-CoA hydratase-related protein [Rhodococcus oxybenzonivorans]MDV7342186.1 enoyl-CoA hydratase-related protein [Rhodococcus oxybenzonivorans]
MTDTAELVQERHGAILVLRLNRPEARNALTGTLMRDLGTVVVEAEADPDIRAIVLTGAGDRAFCSGMDLRSFAEEGEGGFNSEGYARLASGQLTLPVIGAANGTAIGGGLELLLGADVIVASSTAKFGFPEVKRGLFPGGGGTTIGTRLPLHAALEMTLTGDFITADRGYQLGLINAVVEADAVLDTALEYAARIAVNAPLGLAACKELVRLSVSDAARAAERLTDWQSIVFTSADAKEGAAAFIEKRAPIWQGR